LVAGTIPGAVDPSCKRAELGNAKVGSGRKHSALEKHSGKRVLFEESFAPSRFMGDEGLGASFVGGNRDKAGQASKS